MAQAASDAHPRLAALARSNLTLAHYHDAARREVLEHPPSRDAKHLLSRVVLDLCDGFEGFPQRRELVSDRGFALPDVLSFAEHQASISHPETTNVVANLACFAGGRQARVVTLSCGTTPLDNDLFPRGVIVGAAPVALRSNRHRRMCVIGAPPWTSRMPALDLRAPLARRR